MPHRSRLQRAVYWLAPFGGLFAAAFSLDAVELGSDDDDAADGASVAAPAVVVAGPPDIDEVNGVARFDPVVVEVGDVGAGRLVSFCLDVEMATAAELRQLALYAPRVGAAVEVGAVVAADEAAIDVEALRRDIDHVVPGDVTRIHVSHLVVQ